MKQGLTGGLDAQLLISQGKVAPPHSGTSRLTMGETLETRRIARRAADNSERKKQQNSNLNEIQSRTARKERSHKGSVQKRCGLNAELRKNAET